MSCSSVEQQCASPHPRNRCCMAQCSSTLLQQLVIGLTGRCQHAVKTMHQLSRKQASKPASKQASEELIHRAPPAPTCSGCTCRPCLSPAAAHSRHAAACSAGCCSSTPAAAAHTVRAQAPPSAAQDQAVLQLLQAAAHPLLLLLLAQHHHEHCQSCCCCCCWLALPVHPAGPAAVAPAAAAAAAWLQHTLPLSQQHQAALLPAAQHPASSLHLPKLAA